MQIVTLQTKDFKGLPNDIYTFKMDNSISGGNGSGKSSIAEAIIFCLYGRTRTGNSSTSDLIHEAAESTRVAVQFDTGTVVLREESRLYGTRIELNGTPVDQKALEDSLPDFKTFVSIFLIGYFSDLDEAEQRALLLSYTKDVNFKELFENYVRDPDLLNKYPIDFTNLDKAYKFFRDDAKRLTETINLAGNEISWSTDQMKNLKKPKKKIDISKLEQDLDYIQRVNEYNRIYEGNKDIEKRVELLLKTNVCVLCNQKLSEPLLAEQIKKLKEGLQELPTDVFDVNRKVDDTILTLNDKISEAKTNNALFENYEEQILDLEKKKTDAEDRREKSKATLVEVSQIVDALAPSGIRAQAARQQIEPIIAILNKFAGESLPIKIETLHQLKNGTVKEVFKLYANEIPYKYLSTGEKKRVDIALSQTINELSGSTINVFFLDDAELISEPFTLSGQQFKTLVASGKLIIK